MKNEVFNCDCMEYMKNIEDKYFELAIVDPPYGIGDFWKGGDSKKINYRKNESSWNNSIPDKKYFDELFRISKNQIIWGWNYYTNYLGNSDSLILWLKDQSAPNYSHSEIAFTSYKHKIKYFYYSVIANLKERGNHPCSKPIGVYKWLLENYAKPGDKIFDSHVGSGSSRIACYELGFDFIGCELDKDYWEAQERRFHEFKKKFHNEFYIDQENSDLFKDIK